jgi:hypothetical protein
MLQDIEHENYRVRLFRLESFVERAQIDPVFPGVVGSHDRGIRLDTLDVTKLSKATEKESVSTANVENRATDSRGTYSLNDRYN